MMIGPIFGEQTTVNPLRVGQVFQVAWNILGMDGQRPPESLSNELDCLPIGPRGFQAQKKGLLSHFLYQAQKPFYVRAALEENICQVLYFSVVMFAIVILSK